jgi:hypothetical protein
MGTKALPKATPAEIDRYVKDWQSKRKEREKRKANQTFRVSFNNVGAEIEVRVKPKKKKKG